MRQTTIENALVRDRTLSPTSSLNPSVDVADAQTWIGREDHGVEGADGVEVFVLVAAEMGAVDLEVDFLDGGGQGLDEGLDGLEAS